MKKREPFFKLILLSVILGIIVFGSFCSKKPSEDKKGVDETVFLEFDVQKIKDSTGMSFEIVKTKNVGYDPLNKFYWVSVEEKLAEEDLRILAQEIIDTAIQSEPQTYHSFTIHFLQEDKAGASREKPKAFAKVTFLPEGSWTKVGRVPINDYSDYELTCTIVDNVLE
ncbi:MAG TPA: hypothetical protein VFG01_08585 [Acidobacteriota bacterium]|nr:hypothetical protein [Acidobacteriota bacterium]